MKLLLKNADGESVCVTVKQEDTFWDLKTRIAAEDGVDIDIKDFNVEGRPIQNYFNVIQYFHQNSQSEENGNSSHSITGFVAENNVAKEEVSETVCMRDVNTHWNAMVHSYGSHIEKNSNLCRLCAKFGLKDSLTDIELAVEKISSCLGIIVEKDDQLSKLICSSCLKKLNSCKEFQDACVLAEQKQLKMLEERNKLGCLICSKDSSDKSFLSTFEFFEALEKHNQNCIKAHDEEKSDSVDEGSSIQVFCSLCQKHVSLNVCLEGTCHEPNVFCCFLCEATLGTSGDLREHLGQHLSVDSKKSVVVWKCTKCKVEFTDMASFEEHLKTHAGPSINKADTPKQMFRCEMCQKLFRCQSRLDFHMQCHKTGSKPGQCTQCRKEFPSELCLYKHMRYNHLDPKVFPCKHCGKMFRNKSSLTYHSRSHTSLEAMRPFTCDYCKKRFARKNILRDHMTNMHGSRSIPQPRAAFQCRVCREAFPDTTTAISHMVLHHSDHVDDSVGYSFDVLTVSKLFVCELCDKCYSLPKSLAEHRLQHTPPSRYQCKLCNEEFATFVELREHLDSHVSDGIADYKTQFCVPTLYVCEYCEKCFKSYQTFMTHTKSHLSVDSARRYQCQFCAEVFESNEAAVQHRATHKGKESPSQVTNSLKPFECQYCDKSFTSGSTLTKHIRIHTGEKPFPCKVCNKRFSQSSGLYTHLKVHSNERPYQCDLCERSFKLIGDYKQHVRKHSGLRPYSCEECSKTFMTQQAFTQHRKIHTKSRPFVCNVCHESFRRSHTLKIHMRRHEPNCSKS